MNRTKQADEKWDSLPHEAKTAFLFALNLYADLSRAQDKLNSQEAKNKEQTKQPVKQPN